MLIFGAILVCAGVALLSATVIGNGAIRSFTYSTLSVTSLKILNKIVLIFMTWTTDCSAFNLNKATSQMSADFRTNREREEGQQCNIILCYVCMSLWLNSPTCLSSIPVSTPFQHKAMVAIQIICIFYYYIELVGK